jgi:hypothetical protein
MKPKMIINIFLLFLSAILVYRCLTKDWGEYSDDYAYDISIDSAGNSYVAGTTEGNLPGYKNKTKDGTRKGPKTDVFVTKYDSAGTQTWLVQDGTDESDTVNGLGVDSHGNSYVIGSSFFKFDASGSLAWRKEVSGYDIAVDSSDNIYMIIGDQSSRSIAKYDTDGNNLWTYAASKEISSLVLGETGYLYAGGEKHASVGPDDETWQTELFVLKYDANGNQIWVQTISGIPGASNTARIASDRAGAVYIAGSANSDIEVKVALSVTNLYLVKYDSSGNQKWIVQHGNNFSTPAAAVVTDTSGNIYVVGSVSTDLDGLEITSAKIYIMKFDSSGNRLDTYISNYFKPLSMTTDSSSNIFVVGGTTNGGISSPEDSDGSISKMDSSATTLWEDLIRSSPTRYYMWTSKSY